MISNPLLKAAEPLLVAVGEARSTADSVDPDVLHRKLGVGLCMFAEQARDAGIAEHKVDEAIRVLRLFVEESFPLIVDDGEGGNAFPRDGLGSSAEPYTCETFFIYLVDQINAVDRDQIVLEFLYVVLILGLERVILVNEEDAGDVDRLVTGLGHTLERDPTARDLVISPHWRSRVRPSRQGTRRIPQWTLFAVAGFMLLLLSLVFRELAADISDALLVDLQFIARPTLE